METEECTCNIYIPNIFTPNSDGINDNLQVSIQCDFIFEINNFRVFDRWGNNVFSSSNAEEINWNGIFENNNVPAGVYSWILEYSITRNQIKQEFLKSGDITVIR